MGMARIVLAYLVAIFGFAALYALVFPRDFYHSYVKYEREMRDLRARTQQDLMQAIQDQLGKQPDLGNGITFQLDYGLAIGGEQDGALTGSVEIGATLKRGDEQQLFTTRLPVLLSWSGLRHSEKPGAPRVIVENPDQLKQRVQTVYIARDTQKQAQDESILNHESADQTLVADALGSALERVQLSEKQRGDLFSILNVERGFPADAEGTFLRMLYFSAITITTVGYGDIVPLTHWGRLLAACEATLGIVLLGLLVSRLTA
jgi:Ion channel